MIVYNTLLRLSSLPYPTIDRHGESIELMTLSPGDATVVKPPANLYNEDAFLVVAHLHVRCPLSYGGQVRASTTLLHEGLHYRYDPRLALFDNTLEAPANFTSFSAGAHGRTCPLRLPTAPKTALNEHTCVITHGCTQDTFQVPFVPGQRLRDAELLSHTKRPRGEDPRGGTPRHQPAARNESFLTR